MNKQQFRTSLLAGTAFVALLALDGQSAHAQMYSTGPGFYISAEGRYVFNHSDQSKLWSGNGTDTIIGELHDDDDGAGVKARADNGWGGKAMLGYRFNNNWDVGFGFSGAWLKNGKKSFASSTIDEENSQTLKTKLDYQVADFEAGYNWTMGNNSNLRLFGGIRFAHFNQTAKANAFNYECFGRDGSCFSSSTATAAGKRKTTFWGIGPRLGVNGTFGLGNSGFNVFGGVAGAVLFGKFKDKLSLSAHNTTTDGNTSTNHVSGKKNKTKVVPNLEGEIGLGYNFNAGSGSTVGIQVGYRGDAWWGVASDANVIESSFTSHSANVFTHGPFVRLVATFGSAPAAPAAPPPPPPAATAKKSFIVFFDFDKSNITSQAQTTINDAVAAAKAGNSARVTLTGHTDRSGSEQYNMALSLRRAEAVKANMIKQGIPASAIVVIGKGESQPLVPTADGVREPQNRRVEIVI